MPPLQNSPVFSKTLCTAEKQTVLNSSLASAMEVCGGTALMPAVWGNDHGAQAILKDSSFANQKATELFCAFRHEDSMQCPKLQVNSNRALTLTAEYDAFRQLRFVAM